jgi:RNA polymerase sigma-70 factor, ECF subfamily
VIEGRETGHGEGMGQAPLALDHGIAGPASVPRTGAPRLRLVVESSFDLLWRTLRRLGVPEAEVDDAVQRVFLVAARKLDEIEPGKERSFLFSVALRVASDARRTVKRRHEAGDEGLEAMVEPGAGPEDQASQKQARARLDEVLDAMPLELRTVFVLFELEEMQTAEIAALLEIPTGTVASRLRRAREDFQERVKRLSARWR